MRKSIFILFFTVLASNVVIAQTQQSNNENPTRVTTTIHVSATAMQSIELETINNIEFGELQPGQEELYINPISDLNAGYLIATGSPQATLRLNYIPEQFINHSDGKGSINFKYEISMNTIDDQSTAELIEHDNRTIQFNREGRLYIWVGGYLDLKNSIPGNYKADFTLEIDYI